MKRPRACGGNIACTTFRGAVTALLIGQWALNGMTSAKAQQVTPFGDVPASTDFSEAEIAARGQQPTRNLIYSEWTKLCFRGVQGADTKMVCRTTIDGKWDTGQTALRVDLIEREDAPAKRLQIFLPSGFFLQPGVRLTVDKGSSLNVPYTICLANGCVAATVADPDFLHALEMGRILSIEGVNSNVVTAVSSLPLDNFAKTYGGAPAQVFEQKLEGNWERPDEEKSAK
jgi:invasion protein IalB